MIIKIDITKKNIKDLKFASLMSVIGFGFAIFIMMLWDFKIIKDYLLNKTINIPFVLAGILMTIFVFWIQISMALLFFEVTNKKFAFEQFRKRLNSKKLLPRINEILIEQNDNVDFLCIRFIDLYTWHIFPKILLSIDILKNIDSIKKNDSDSSIVKKDSGNDIKNDNVLDEKIDIIIFKRLMKEQPKRMENAKFIISREID